MDGYRVPLLKKPLCLLQILLISSLGAGFGWLHMFGDFSDPEVAEASIARYEGAPTESPRAIALRD